MKKLVCIALLATACSSDRDPDVAESARSLYPAYLAKLQLADSVVIDDIVAQTDLMDAQEGTDRWSSLMWLPPPGGLVRTDGVVRLAPEAAAAWPPRAPTVEPGKHGSDFQLAVLVVTAHVGDRSFVYQSLLKRDPVRGDVLADPVLGTIQLAGPRLWQEKEAPGADPRSIKKQAFACDGKEHTVAKLSEGPTLVGVCRSWCDTEYVRFQAFAESKVTLTCPKEADCSPTGITPYNGARVDMKKFHDEAMQDEDKDDSTYITWTETTKQLECDYAWPCTHDYIGVTWEGAYTSASVYDDASKQVGAASSTAAHGAITSKGEDVVFAAPVAWGLVLTQIGTTLLMTAPAMFQMGHTGQLDVNIKIGDAFATAVAICDPDLVAVPADQQQH
jgi:hypothetical protein